MILVNNKILKRVFDDARGGYQHSLQSAVTSLVFDAKFLRLVRDGFTKFESVDRIEKPGETLSKC